VVTIDDVARRAGVSASTVSHVLNNTRRVNPDTREQVTRAIADLGYRRNSAARTLAGGSSQTIGLVISGISNVYFGPLLNAIERRVSEAGYVLVLGDTHEDSAVEQRVVDSLLDQRVDGLIVAPSIGFLEQAAPRIVTSGTPVVLIDRNIALECDQLVPENTKSAQQLTEHLIDHGHTRIAAVVGLRGLDSTADREAGYLAALGKHALAVDPSLIVAGESTPDIAERAVSELLSRPDPPRRFFRSTTP